MSETTGQERLNSDALDAPLGDHEGATGGGAHALMRDAQGMDHAGGAEAMRPGGERTAPKKPKKSRAQILREKKNSIEKIEDLLSYGAFDWAVTDKEADQALSLLQRMGMSERMVVIQSMNGRDGKFMERLIDNAPKGSRKNKASAYLTVLSVSGKTKTIKGLLKQLPRAAGVTGKDSDAVGMTLKSLDPSDVKGYGERDGHRFSDWLALSPEPIKKSLGPIFQQSRADKQAADQAAEERAAEEAAFEEEADAMLEDDAQLKGNLDQIEDLLSYGAFDWAITDKEARKALTIFNSMGSADQVRAVVMKLDQGKFMDRFIDNLSPEDRWNNKRTFLRIIAARSPAKNVPYVRELLSYGVFDWAVNDEEARLAFQLVKTMPKDLRDRFQKADGGTWWGRMEGNLAQEDKTAEDAHFYQNEEETQQLKLDFIQSAGQWSHARLSTAIAMLTRMGEEDWVEAELQSKGFDQDPEYGWIYSNFGFARAGGERNPAIFEAFKEKTFMEKAGEFFAAVGSGAKLLGKAVGNAIDAGVTGDASMTVDLQDVQNVMGGDVMGVKFAEKEGSNTLTADVDLDSGLYSVSIPSLDIASIAQMLGDTRIQTGAVKASGISVSAKFATEDDPSQFFTLSVGGVDAKDIWYITESSMTSAGAVSLSDFSVSAERPPQSSKPADQAEFTSMVITEVQETLQRLFGMLQMQDPKPEAIGMRLGQSFSSEMKASVSLGSLEISDVADSAGGYAGNISVSGVDVSAHNQRKGPIARARLAELTSGEGEPSAEEQAEIEELRQLISRLAPLEAREIELTRKESADALELWEEEELTQLRDELTTTTTEVSLDALQVQNVDMQGVQAEELSVKDAKASLTAAAEMAEDTDDATMDSDLTGTFSVGEVSGTNLVLEGANKLDAYDARIAALLAKIDGGKGTDADVELLGQLRTTVAPVHRMIVQRDAIRLKAPRSAGDDAELSRLNQELAPWLAAGEDTSVASLSASGVTGSVDAESGQGSIGAAALQASGVRSGGNSVDSVSATDASADFDLGGDMRLGVDPAKLQSASATAGSVEATGVAMAGQSQSAALSAQIQAIELKQELGTATADDAKALEKLRAQLTTVQAKEARLAELRAQVGEGGGASDMATITARALNVRSGPGTDHGKVGLLRGGERVRVVGREGRWLNVEHGGEEAWIHSGYAKMSEGARGELAAELEALEAELAASDTTVGSVSAQNVSASLDETTGEASVSGDNIAVSDVSSGGMKVGSATVASAKADVTMAPGAMSSGKLGGDIQASVKTTGVQASDVSQGKAGTAGAMKVDSLSVDSATVDYDSAKDDGRLEVDVEGAEMEGFEMASNTLRSVEGAIGTLTAKQNTEGLTEKEAESLAELREQLAEYHDLKARHAQAGPKRRKALAAEIAAWEQTSTTRVEEARLEDLDMAVTGVGNVLDEDYDPMSQTIDLESAESSGFSASGIDAGGNRVKSVSATGISASGSDLLNEDGRHLEANVDEVKGKGFRGDGVGASSFKAKGIDATVDGKDASADIDYAGAGGAWGSGASVGYAGAGGVHVDVQNMGEDDQSVSGRAASVRAKRVKHTSGDMTSEVDQLRGRGVTFGMDEGGAMNANIRQFSGEGVNVVQGEGDAQSTYGVDSFEGRGAGVSMNGASTNVGLQHAQASGVKASGAATGGHDVVVDTVTVDGVAADLNSATGDFSANLQGASATGVNAKKGDAEVANVGSVSIQDASASGNMNDMSVKQAGVGQAVVKDVRFDHEGKRGTVDLVTVKDAGASDVTMTTVVGEDGKESTQIDATASVGSVAVEGADVTMDGEEGGARRVQVDSATVSDINASVQGGVASGSYGRVESGRLIFTDTTDPANRIHAVMTAFSAGSEEQASTFSMDAAGEIDADLQTITIGKGSTFNFGEGGADQVKFFDEVSAGRIQVTDFDPAELTSAGSSLVISEIEGERILYDTKTRKAFIRGASVDKVFVSGLGDDQIMAGFSGMEADQLNYQEQDASGQTVTRAQITDARLPGGYAVLQQGESFEVAYAKLAGVEAGNIEADLYLKPEEGAAQQSSETREVPGLGTVRLDALRRMNGTINVSAENPATAVYGVVAEIPVRNGKIHLNDLYIEVDNWGPNMTLNPGDSGFDRWVLRKVIKKFAKLQGDAVDVADFMEAMAKASEEPSQASEGDEDTKKMLEGVTLNASITDIQGRVQVGENSAHVDSATVAASGNLGGQVNASITDAKVSRIRVMGNTEIDQATVKRIDTAVINPLEDEKRVTVRVQDGKVGTITYNPSGASSSSQNTGDSAYEQLSGQSAPGSSRRRP